VYSDRSTARGQDRNRITFTISELNPSVFVLNSLFKQLMIGLTGLLAAAAGQYTHPTRVDINNLIDDDYATT